MSSTCHTVSVENFTKHSNANHIFGYPHSSQKQENTMTKTDGKQAKS